MFFNVLLFVAIFVCYTISRRYENSKKIFLITLGVVVVAIFGSRYFINDYPDEGTYNYLYVSFSGKNWGEFYNSYNDIRDFGFYLAYWLMSQIIPWSQFPIYFITAICVFSFFRFIYNNSDDELLSVVLFFSFGIFSFYMAAYRQTFAMCVTLFAFEKAKKRKLFGFAVLSAIAISMHISSMAFLPIYYIMGISRDKYSTWKRIGILAGIALLCGPVIQFFAGESGKDSYTDRLDFSLVGFAIQIIIMLAPFVLNVFKKNSNKDIDQFVFATDTVLLSGLVMYVFKLMYYSFERISYYYTFSIVSVFPSSVERLDNNSQSKKLIKFVAIILLAGLYFWRSQGSSLKFFWNV